MRSRPNVLIVIADQLSAQALKAWGNGHSATPAIDRLVEGGVRFEHAYTPCPLCQPARAAFWTGRYPHQTGVLSNGGKRKEAGIPADMPTLGDVFRGAGYRTVHFGKTHDAGSLRGFDVVESKRKQLDDVSPAWPVDYDSELDRDTRAKAIEFLTDYRGPAPYVAVADLNNPHDICNWIGKNQHGELPVPEGVALPPLPENLHLDREEFLKRPLPIQYICCAHNRQAQVAEWDEAQISKYLAAYYHYMARLDRDVDLVLGALRRRPDADRTLVVFMADHGDSMCGRWMATKHTSFYDETTRVPFVFAGPGITGPGRAVHGPVSLLDLFPTLCELADIASPDGLAGRSLMPCLREPERRGPHDFVIGQWFTEWAFTVEPGRMVRTDRYKYTHWLEGEGEELYDLSADPGEMRTLIDDPAYAGVLADHRALLKLYTDEALDPYFSLQWEAAPRWRSHPPGYRNHRGLAAPKAE